MFPFFYDPTMVLLIPAILLAVYAQMKVRGTFARYLNVPAQSGRTGAQVARDLLDSSGLQDVTIDVVPGRLTDHYDPRHRILRLSADVFHGRSLAAIGVAAHETGHAVQHGRAYFPLSIRNGLFPVANIGSRLAFPLFILGFFMQSPMLIDIGIILFAFAVGFQVITLPVEFNASSRALAMLEGRGILARGPEVEGARKVLSAAALTYVAATAVALLQLVRLLLIRGSRED